MPGQQRRVSRAVKAYELKVTLMGIRPAVWRRIAVRNDITLDALHKVLQAVMGWTDSHMHAFQPVGRESHARSRQPAVERNDERRTRLDELLIKPKDRLVYEYDFGDSWEHEVLLERVGDHPAGARYPWVLGGARACPPEDVGGVSGYAHFLQVMRSPRHPDHAEMMEWHGRRFDPEAFDAQALNRAFHGGWAPARRDG